MICKNGHHVEKQHARSNKKNVKMSQLCKINIRMFLFDLFEAVKRQQRPLDRILCPSPFADPILKYFLYKESWNFYSM